MFEHNAYFIDVIEDCRIGPPCRKNIVVMYTTVGVIVIFTIHIPF